MPGQDFDFLHEYRSGASIAAAFGLPGLADLKKETGTKGAARLFLLPSNEREGVLTVSFCADGLKVSVALSDRSFWEFVQDRAFGRAHMPFTPAYVRTVSWFVPKDLESDAFLALPEFLALAQRCPDWEPLALDGVSYLHHWWTPDGERRARWHNPNAAETPEQVRLLKRYEVLFTSGIPDFPFWKAAGCGF